MRRITSAVTVAAATVVTGFALAPAAQADTITLPAPTPGAISVTGGAQITHDKNDHIGHQVTLPATQTTTTPHGLTVPVVPLPTATASHGVGLKSHVQTNVKLPSTTVSLAPVKVGLNAPSLPAASLPPVKLPAHQLPKLGAPQVSVHTDFQAKTPHAPKLDVTVTTRNLPQGTSGTTTTTTTTRTTAPATTHPATTMVAHKTTTSSAPAAHHSVLAATGSQVKPWLIGAAGVVMLLGLDFLVAGRRARFF